MAEYGQKVTIGDFLAAAASRQPTPGGGSVAALAGALAASMGEMAVHYSVSKKNPQPGYAALQIAVNEFHRARQLLLSLMTEDQAAYEALTAARKMSESPQKAEAVAAALTACVAAPQAVAAAAKAILELAQSLAPRVNPLLLSDLAVCAEMAMATVRCAIYNVRVNLPDVTDVQKRRAIEAQNSQLLTSATAIIQKTIPAIWDRLSRPESKP
jgi:glutamate formiminotransferase/formiminotetrahydrofolate cyclodeaminase